MKVISYYYTSRTDESNNEIFNTKTDHFKSNKDLRSVLKEFTAPGQSALALFIKFNDDIKFAIIKQDHKTFNLFYINISKEVQESEDFTDALDEIEKGLPEGSKLENQENNSITFNRTVEDLAKLSSRNEDGQKELLKKLSNYLDQKSDEYCITDEKELFSNLSCVFNAVFQFNDPSNTSIRIETLDVISKLKDKYPKLLDQTVKDVSCVRDWAKKVIDEHRNKIAKLLQKIKAKKYQDKDTKEELIKSLKKYTDFTLRISKIFPKVLTEDNLKTILNIYEEIAEEDLLKSRVKFTQFISKCEPQLLAAKDIDDYIKSLGHVKSLEELSAEKGQIKNNLEQLYKGLHYRSADHKNAWNQRDDSSYYYQYRDIYEIQNILLGGKARILGNTEYVKKETKHLIDELKDNTPAFFIYNIGNNHWTCFTALREGKTIKILYKDSQGDDVDGRFKSSISSLEDQLRSLAIEQNYSLEFLLHKTCEQTDGVDCGIFALANLRIMQDKIEHNRTKFVQNFANEQFCTLKKAQELRADEYAKCYLKSAFQSQKKEFADKSAKEQLNYLLDYLHERRDQG